jgi:hypothetical protein
MRAADAGHRLMEMNLRGRSSCFATRRWTLSRATPRRSVIDPIVTAFRLWGVDVILSGPSSETARTLVTIRVDLGTMHMVRDVPGNTEEAERQLGFRVSEVPYAD